MNEKLTQLVSEILSKNQLPEIKPALRDIPFEGQLGLAVSNVFQIARAAYPDASKEDLAKRADEISDLIARELRQTGEFEKVESVKSYVNCFFNPGAFGRDITARIFQGGIDWGRSAGIPGKVMVEYSQPNTHKAFHVGHVRNVVTGACLLRCFRYAGRETLAANYYGDIGSHVFKSLWYLNQHFPDLLSKTENVAPADRGRWLGDVYTKASKELSETDEIMNQVWETLKLLFKLKQNELNEEDLFEGKSKEDRYTIIDDLASKVLDPAQQSGIRPIGDTSLDFAAELADDLNQKTGTKNYSQIQIRERELKDIADKWNSGDENLHKLWDVTRQWSLDDFHRIYKELDADFDIEFYESQVEQEGLKIVGELEKIGIVADSNGAKIVEIDKQLHERLGEPLKDKFRVMVLVRTDGASLYGAKDLALARKKFEEYDIDESIYVVGNEQKFYFAQLFQVLRLMGFPQWEKCFHLSYELVMLPSGKISSRAGQVVLYDDVMAELRERALNVVREKNPDLDDKSKSEVSEAVAKGALIYGMLRVDTNKKIEFDFDEVLDFNGRSAPYIQYAATRAASIFRKAVSEGIDLPDSIIDSDFSGELKPIEVELIKLLARFPEIVKKVVDEKKPIHLASYLYDVAVAYSDFYHQCPVLIAEPDVRRHRLILVRAVRITLEAGLGLMGIDTPDVM